MISWTRLIARSLTYHLRIHGAVALGVAAATAVLTGALLVGDSVRGSLRDLALDQLGEVDEVVLSDRFYRQQLADELQSNDTFQQDFQSATPVVLFPQGAVQTQADPPRRAGRILIVGCDQRFWQLGEVEAPAPDYDEIVLNEPLARDLQVEAGDRVIVRLPGGDDVPAESTLARKTGRVRTIAALEVIAVVPAESLGRFSLRPNQSQPRNAYVSLEQLQDALEQEGKVNTLLISSGRPQPPGEEASRRLAEALRPRFEDYGLTLEEARQTWSEDGRQREAFHYWSVTSSRMVFAPETDEALAAALAPLGAQPVMTYMVNTIALDGEPDERGIPYSTASGIDPSPHFQVVDVDGRRVESLADDEVLLHEWTAGQLDAQVGDRVSLRYFAPESTHGSPDELEDLFRVRAVVPLAEPAEPFDDETPAVYQQRPSVFNDPHFTPTVEGITDQDTIDTWDPPFPYDSQRVQPRDDTYWDNHRTTPKAFVSLEAARRMWSSRFGETTSYRVPAAGLGAEQVRQAVADELHRRGSPGFRPTPVKREALQASSGTTPFDVLFIALSFFIIAAALILVSLLFQLGVEQRAEEAGTLLAVGMSRGRTSRLLSAEGAAVSAAGALLGTALGVGYAKLMVTGLSHWWVDAIATPFLSLHVTARSLLLGYLLGVAACVLTIVLRLRRMRRLSIRRLLSGEAGEESGPRGRKRAGLDLAAGLLAAASVGLGFAAANMTGGEAQAGGFVGAGGLILTALLLAVWNRLRGSALGSAAAGLGSLASRNASRNPTRSTLVVGLMAVASFLIVAMSAFRLAPTREGSGGFQLVGESSLPVFADLGSPQGRRETFADPSRLEDVTILSLRAKRGDDASCRNLYQSVRPRVLGVTDAMIDYYDQPREAPFAWAAADAADAEQPRQREAGRNHWRLLRDDPGPGAPVPAVLDKNTAMYSLHLYGGVGETFTVDYEDGRQVEFRVAGLLSNSILQGSVLIGERAFRRLFPEASGFRYFLAGGPQGRAEQIRRTMEEALSDQGLDMRSADELLQELLSVQNTYLSTFQSLGLLGLLLGTFGLATVQVRSVFERRKELALMRAAGFHRRQLAWMVMLENMVLLLMGLAVGSLSAVVAVLPYGLTTGASVPWSQLGWMLGLVLATGLLTGLLAVQATLRAPLVAALRGE